jgi:transposase-like protein
MAAMADPSLGHAFRERYLSGQTRNSNDRGDGPEGASPADPREEPGAKRGDESPPPRPRTGRRDSSPERLMPRPGARVERSASNPNVRAALARLAAGEPPESIADELGIPSTTLRMWREREHRSELAAEDRLAMLERENARLRKLVERLRLDRYMLEQLLKTRS